MFEDVLFSIEGIPVIIRFKTVSPIIVVFFFILSIEGIPVIIRFKTHLLQGGSFSHLY